MHARSVLAPSGWEFVPLSRPALGRTQTNTKPYLPPVRLRINRRARPTNTWWEELAELDADQATTRRALELRDRAQDDRALGALREDTRDW